MRNKGYPNLWECTGGSALAGDSSLDAAIREVREETGILLSPDRGECILSIKRKHEFVDIWLFRRNFDLAEVQLLPGETIDRMAADSKEILAMRERGEFIPCSYLDEVLEHIKY